MDRFLHRVRGRNGACRPHRRRLRHRPSGPVFRGCPTCHPCRAGSPSRGQENARVILSGRRLPRRAPGPAQRSVRGTRGRGSPVRRPTGAGVRRRSPVRARAARRTAPAAPHRARGARGTRTVPGGPSRRNRGPSRALRFRGQGCRCSRGVRTAPGRPRGRRRRPGRRCDRTLHGRRRPEPRNPTHRARRPCDPGTGPRPGFPPVPRAPSPAGPGRHRRPVRPDRFAAIADAY